MIAFLDTSAFAKRYLTEPGSESVRRLFRGRRQLAASRLAYVELCSAVARAWRLAAIGERQRDEIFDRLPGDLGNLACTIEPNRDVYSRAVELLRTYPLRAYDAMQLSSCLELISRGTATELWTEDGPLVAAAREERLKVVIPS